MKAFISLALVLCLQTSDVSALRCWECENVFSQEECLEKGRMVECDETQNTCQITLRQGGWGNRPLIEKACKQQHACGTNHNQDTKTASVFARDTEQCNMKVPSSVCRCCCNTDGCNHEVLFCEGWTPGGQDCPRVSPPRFGYMVCEGGMQPESECRFSCRSGFQMVGSPVSRCNLYSERDYPAPVCRRILCPALREQRFGSYRCTRGRRLKSRCTFSCDEGNTLIGAEMVECILTENRTAALWSRVQPICRPPMCPRQSIGRNGQMSCTDLFFVESTCSFECDEGFELSPSGAIRNRCQRNQEWTRPAPCCRLPCPPNAVMDFVVILDSSSSVGAENWVRMKEFVRLFLSDFTVSDQATHFAVIRYNRIVDTSTQILLNEYPNSLADVLQAFDRIPYDGSGTNTGNALNYTASTLLRIGNRPEARDVVLLITDGRSNDDVVVPSDNLHATGALVFVLPVLPPRGRLDLDQVREIARDEANIIDEALVGGFDALDAAFARRISGILCQGQCS